MSPPRTMIQTTKGAQALLDARSSLDRRHLRVLALLDGEIDAGGIASKCAISEAEAAEVLQKLALVGYARPASLARGEDLDEIDLPRHAKATFGVEGFGPAPTGSDLDVWALLVAARLREKAMGGAPSLGTAEDVWRATEAHAMEILNAKLHAERAQRAAAESALAQAEERERRVQASRRTAEEALARSRLEARAKALQAAAEEAAREAALEVERARARRQGVYRRRRHAAFALVLVAAAGSGAWRAQHALSLSPDLCSRLLSDWSGRPSKVAACESSLFPPRFEALGIESGSISIESARGTFSFLDLFAGRSELESLSLAGLRLDAAGASTLLRVPPVGRVGKVREVAIESARVTLGSLALAGLKGSAQLDAQGLLTQIVLLEDARSTRLSLEREKGAVKFSFQMRFPDSASAPVPGATEVSAFGSFANSGFAVESGTLSLKAGSALFSGAAAWRDGLWSGGGKFESKSARLAEWGPWLFNEGSADLAGTFSFKGAGFEQALAGSSFEASGLARDVALKVDLNDMLGVSGSMGFSTFPQVQFKAGFARGTQSFSLPQLSSGKVRGSVEARLSSSGSVSGSVRASIPERSLSTEAVLSGTASRISSTPVGR